MAKSIDFSSNVELRSRMNEVARLMHGAAAVTIQKGVDLAADAAKRHVAVDTGLLQQSIRGRVRKARGRDELMGSVSTNTKNKVKPGRTKKNTFGYGMPQERGMMSRPSYSFKPYLVPGAQDAAPQIIDTLKAESAKAARSQPR